MSDLVGQQLGNYSIVKLIGRGSFGDVYLGEHIILGRRQVAIKVLHSSIDHEGERERFLQEALLLAKLSHPHILSIFDAGIYDSFPYLVTAYAPKGNLRLRYPHGFKVRLNIVVILAKQVATALQYAHDQGLIHRDVKPENMLLNSEDAVLLSDFGVAVTAHSTHSQGNQDLAGTVSYIAPEQLQGKSVRASDQYSLGVVVYEWLCGRRPFQGPFAEIATQHLFVPPPALRELVPTISPEVEQVIMQALSKEPKQRFSSIAEFATELEKAAQLLSASRSLFISDQQLSLSKDKLPQATSSFPTISEADELTLPAPTKDISNQDQKLRYSNEKVYPPSPDDEKTYHTLPFSPDDEKTYHTLPFSPEAEKKQQTSLPSSTHDNLNQISDTDLASTPSPKNSSLLQAAQSFFGLLLPTVNTPQGTKGTIKQGTTLSIWRHTQEVYAVVWSPDDKFIASAGADKTIQIWEVSTIHKLPGYRANSKVYALAWSPDGKLIASGEKDKMIQIWNVATAREHFSYSDSVSGGVYALTWSPDGKYIASGGVDGIIHVWDVSRRNEFCTFSGHTDWIRSVAWSPDGKYIASASNDRTVCIWNFISRAVAPIITFTKHIDWVRAVVWSPDGMHIASAGDSQEIYVWNATTGATTISYANHATKWMGGVLTIAWSPDGKRIASAGENQTIQLWDTIDGKHIFTYKGHSAPVNALSWSPDGQRIASGSYDWTVRIWQAVGVTSKTTMDNTQPGKAPQ